MAISSTFSISDGNECWVKMEFKEETQKTELSTCLALSVAFLKKMRPSNEMSRN